MLNKYRLVSDAYKREDESDKILPEKIIFYLWRAMIQKRNILMGYRDAGKK